MSLFYWSRTSRFASIHVNERLSDPDGMELTYHIRERYNVKVDVVTGMDDCHDEAIAAGASGYVRKPQNLKRFLKLIKNLLNS